MKRLPNIPHRARTPSLFMPITYPEQLWCDGGVLGRNPSPLGGSWAYVWVSGGRVIRRRCGLVEPSDLGMIPTANLNPTISNNITELLAALFALESVPHGWTGQLHTDSSVTMYRLQRDGTLNSMPSWLRERVVSIRRSRNYKVVLVAGHPDASELAAGVKRKNGLPVSRFNVLCDTLCGRVAERWKTRLEEKRKIREDCY